MKGSGVAWMRKRSETGDWRLDVSCGICRRSPVGVIGESGIRFDSDVPGFVLHVIEMKIDESEVQIAHMI